MAANDGQALDLKYDSAPRRRARMVSMIADNGYCTITELAAAFDVSEMTIRRDVARIAVSDRSLRVVHGGISSVPAWQSDGTDYRTRSVTSRGAKFAIATEAVRLLRSGQTIALDSGTTTLHIAEAIPDGLQLNVVTQSLAVANALAPKETLELTLLGGTYVRALEAFVGTATTKAIADLSIDVLFLATTSIDERGVLAGNEYDAATKRAWVEVAETIVLVSDSTKFNRKSRFRVCPLARITLMVTDEGITEGSRRMMENAGLRIITAAANGTAYA